MSPDLPTAAELAQMSKLFSLLDDKGRSRLLAGATRRSAAAGETLCREGEKGEEFFVVVSGKVNVTADDFGNAKQIAVLGRGGFFGEMSVVANQPRSATVVADGPVELLAFTRKVVEEVLKDYPVVRQALGQVGVRRTEELLEKLNS